MCLWMCGYVRAVGAASVPTSVAERARAGGAEPEGRAGAHRQGRGCGACAAETMPIVTRCMPPAGPHAAAAIVTPQRPRSSSPGQVRARRQPWSALTRRIRCQSNHSVSDPGNRLARIAVTACSAAGWYPDTPRSGPH